MLGIEYSKAATSTFYIRAMAFGGDATAPV